MRILDRYILKELLGPIFFGICVFASILVGTGPLFRIASTSANTAHPCGPAPNC